MRLHGDVREPGIPELLTCATVSIWHLSETGIRHAWYDIGGHIGADPARRVADMAL
jgi:hypothetical protein